MHITIAASAPTIIANVADALSSRRWIGEGYFWNSRMSRGDFRNLEDGDYILTCQRWHETLEIVLHKNGGLQYVYTFNDDYEQKYERGGIILDFLSVFI